MSQKNYDLSKEDPLQKYMLDASHKSSFEKKFFMQSKMDSDFMQTKLTKTESESEEDDNLLVLNQECTSVKPAEDLSQTQLEMTPSKLLL